MRSSTNLYFLFRKEIPRLHDRRNGVAFGFQFKDTRAGVADCVERLQEGGPVYRTLPRAEAIVFLSEVVVQVDVDKLPAVTFEVVADRLTTGVLRKVRVACIPVDHFYRLILA